VSDLAEVEVAHIGGAAFLRRAQLEVHFCVVALVLGSRFIVLDGRIVARLVGCFLSELFVLLWDFDRLLLAEASDHHCEDQK